MCVCHTQFAEYVLDICFHMEDRLIIILPISVISPTQHVQDKRSNSRPEKANSKLCTIGPMTLSPRKGEHNISGID